jgi:hypothetical protein
VLPNSVLDDVADRDDADHLILDDRNVAELARRHPLHKRADSLRLVACDDAAYRDGANQLGDLREGAYSDWTRWRPVNPPDKLVDARRCSAPMDSQGA